MGESFVGLGDVCLVWDVLLGFCCGRETVRKELIVRWALGLFPHLNVGVLRVKIR